MSDVFDQIVTEWAELGPFATTLMAWCQHPTGHDRDYLARRARRLADLRHDPAPFQQFADWLDQQQQDQTGGDTR